MERGGQKPELHCDFCNKPVPDTQWRFKCRAFTHDGNMVGGVRIGFINPAASTDWCACDECKDLIVAGYRDSLVQRSLSSEHSEWVNLTRSLPRTERRQLRRTIRGLHDAFWSHREGAPVRETGVPS